MNSGIYKITCTSNNQTYIGAHHKTSLSSIINKYNITLIDEAKKCVELWDINNGITLCRDCHIEETWGTKI